jgi:hypothetical protein
MKKLNLERQVDSSDELCNAASSSVISKYMTFTFYSFF